MNTPSNTQAQTEQNPTKTINDLHRAFSGVVTSYAITECKVTVEALDCLETDCKRLAMISKAMRLQAKDSKISHTSTPNHISLDDIIKEQNQQRGLEPLALEPELLLKRISDGGYSGQYLADAFLSAYRTNKPFSHSLGELIKLDAEGFRLFHQILHIRHIQGWNDDSLYQIEQQIKAIVGGVA
jgi:hypothetical protein